MCLYYDLFLDLAPGSVLLYSTDIIRFTKLIYVLTNLYLQMGKQHGLVWDSLGFSCFGLNLFCNIPAIICKSDLLFCV